MENAQGRTTLGEGEGAGLWLRSGLDVRARLRPPGCWRSSLGWSRTGPKSDNHSWWAESCLLGRGHRIHCEDVCCGEGCCSICWEVSWGDGCTFWKAAGGGGSRCHSTHWEAVPGKLLENVHRRPENAPETVLRDATRRWGSICGRGAELTRGGEWLHWVSSAQLSATGAKSRGAQGTSKTSPALSPVPSAGEALPQAIRQGGSAPESQADRAGQVCSGEAVNRQLASSSPENVKNLKEILTNKITVD